MWQKMITLAAPEENTIMYAYGTCEAEKKVWLIIKAVLKICEI